MFTILSDKLNSGQDPVVFIFKKHFLTLKLTSWKGAKLDDVIG